MTEYTPQEAALNEQIDREIQEYEWLWSEVLVIERHLSDKKLWDKIDDGYKRAKIREACENIEQGHGAHRLGETGKG